MINRESLKTLNDFVKLLVKKPASPSQDRRAVKLEAMQRQFVEGFANKMDALWREEREQLPWRRRTLARMILIGQGGSGKSFVVKYVVVPTLQWAFPADGTSESDRFLLFVHSHETAAGLHCESF